MITHQFYSKHSYIRLNESDSESFNLMSSLSHPTQQKPQTPEESAITTQSEAIGSTITPARAPFIYLAEQSKTL